MSLQISIITSQKKAIADVLRSIAMLIEEAGNKRVEIVLTVNFQAIEAKKQ